MFSSEFFFITHEPLHLAGCTNMFLYHCTKFREFQGHRSGHRTGLSDFSSKNFNLLPEFPPKVGFQSQILHFGRKFSDENKNFRQFATAENLGEGSCPPPRHDATDEPVLISDASLLALVVVFRCVQSGGSQGVVTYGLRDQL